MSACGANDHREATAREDATTTSGREGPSERPFEIDFGEDILSTGLALDLAARKGIATIAIRAPKSGFASFESGDLEVRSVLEAGEPIRYRHVDGRLDVDVGGGSSPEHTLVVTYAFAGHEHFDGWYPEKGFSFLWPHFCGNLFPCKSDPSDGTTFTLAVTGVPDGAIAVFPKSIAADAPSYMPAIAVGNYARDQLGETSAGTRVSVFHRRAETERALAGTAHLRDVFDFYERTYGPYSFGRDVASVSVDWPPGAFGGMEHHPYWHVASDAFADEYTHAHEAAHGWFGDGVRIACWEDFVLSEGTASYIAARALQEVGVDAWATLGCDLVTACTTKNTIALPPSCAPMDLLTNPLWSITPYAKGAFFYRAVAAEIGVRTVDTALGAFYRSHVTRAARMRDVVDAFEHAAPDKADEIESIANAWLSTLACPIDPKPLCKRAP